VTLTWLDFPDFLQGSKPLFGQKDSGAMFLVSASIYRHDWASWSPSFVTLKLIREPRASNNNARTRFSCSASLRAKLWTSAWAEVEEWLYQIKLEVVYVYDATIIPPRTPGSAKKSCILGKRSEMKKLLTFIKNYFTNIGNVTANVSDIVFCVVGLQTFLSKC
jgi:hypothetical protein